MVKWGWQKSKAVYENNGSGAVFRIVITLIRCFLLLSYLFFRYFVKVVGKIIFKYKFRWFKNASNALKFFSIFFQVGCEMKDFSHYLSDQLTGIRGRGIAVLQHGTEFSRKFAWGMCLMERSQV